MKYEIPEGWSFAWAEEKTKLCSKCQHKLITIKQYCGDNYTQYEIRCTNCGFLVDSHYED